MLRATGLILVGLGMALAGCLSGEPANGLGACDEPWGKRECINICDPEYAADSERIQAGPREIVAGKYCFTPSGLTIRAGESVTFINDDVTHSITVRRVLDEESGTWEPYAGRNLYLTNRTWTLEFEAPGSYFVMCSLHAGGVVRGGRELTGGMVLPDGIRVIP